VPLVTSFQTNAGFVWKLVMKGFNSLTQKLTVSKAVSRYSLSGILFFSFETMASRSYSSLAEAPHQEDTTKIVFSVKFFEFLKYNRESMLLNT
jgi:hypothetical protein